MADSGNHLIRAVVPTHTCFGISNKDPNVCSSNGYCAATDVCTCSPGYGGDCSLSICFGLLSNESTTCSGNGGCVAPDTCECNPGYTGGDCSLSICFDLLSNDSSVCSSNGRCTGPDSCTCDAGYYDLNCSIPMCFAYLSNETAVCSGYGACISPNYCVCQNTYIGNQCQMYISIESKPAFSPTHYFNIQTSLVAEVMIRSLDQQPIDYLSDFTFEWSIYDRIKNKQLIIANYLETGTTSESRTVMLKSNVLAPNNIYQLVCHVTTIANSRTTSSQFIFHSSIAPLGGIIQSSSEVGKIFVDQFEFITRDWIPTEPNNTLELHLFRLVVKWTLLFSVDLHLVIHKLGLSPYLLNDITLTRSHLYFKFILRKGSHSLPNLSLMHRIGKTEQI